MTEVTSARVLKIAARRINDPDPEVAALAASCLTQAPDQAGGLTPNPGLQPMTKYTYNGPAEAKEVGGRVFNKGEAVTVTDLELEAIRQSGEDFTEVHERKPHPKPDPAPKPPPTPPEAVQAQPDPSTRLHLRRTTGDDPGDG